MKIQVLHIDDCPNSEQAGERVREALDALGLREQVIEYVLIETEADAAQLVFAGSPTILIDGADAVPSGGRTTDLACRVYQTEKGMAGAPSVSQLTAAIGAHLAV